MNREKLRDGLEKIKTTLGKISRTIWIIIGVCLAVMIAVIIFLIWSNHNKPYAVLIDQANNEEFSSVLTWLQDQGITDYKTEGSSAILVPSSQAVMLKARLLQQQYSSANLSSSLYFERVGALSTQADREMASRKDLEAQLNSVIRSFSGVLDATVIINLGEDNGYVLYKNNVVNASASVKVTMQQGKILSTEQAKAIRNYVAHAVPELDVDDVYLTDTIGNTYSDFSTSGNSQSDSVLMLQVKEELENRLRTQITQALAKGFLGEENVSVVPNVTVELGDKTVNTHDVKLPEFAQDGSTGGRGIIGSEFWVFQFLTPDSGAVGGVVGTTTNADLPTYVEPGEAQAELQRILEEEANRIYDNSYEDTVMVIHCATVSDVSVAVWVNGGVLKDPSQINKDDLRSLVAAAAHIEPVLTDEVTREDYLNWKIQVMTDPFATLPVEPEPGPDDPIGQPGTIWGIPFWVFIAAGVGLLVFVVVLVLILVLRGKKRKKEEAERQALIETMMAAAEPGQIVQLDEEGNPVYVSVGGEPELDEEGNPVTGANVMDLHTEKSMELRQSIRDFVDENMEVAALLLKSWMKEGGESG